MSGTIIGGMNGTIRRVSIQNFACHEKTELELPEGLVVFVGRNGAGKSSVIDAITYALYGEHSRGDNKNIARDGAGGGQVELEFSLGGVDYKVLRRFNSKGELEHSFLKSKGKTLAVGERKRESEDVTRQINRLFGIGYNQMLSAVVIRQGELDHILSEQPKDVKNLFDEIMGLAKMEEAYKHMHYILEDFRNRVYEKAGWDLNDLQKVEEELQNKRQELESNLKRREQLEKELAEIRKQIDERAAYAEELKKAKEWHSEAWKQFAILRSRLEQLKENIEGSLDTFEECLQLLRDKNTVENRKRELESLENERREIELTLRKKDGELRGIKTSLQKLEVPERLLKNAVPLKKLRSEAAERVEKLKNDSVELGKRLALKQKNAQALKKQVRNDMEEIVEIVSESYYAGSAREAVGMAEKRKKLLTEKKEVTKQIKGLRKELNEINKKIKKLSYINDEHVTILYEEIRDAENAIERLGGLGERPKLQENLTAIRNALKIFREAEEQQALPQIGGLKGLGAVLGEDKTLHQLMKLLEKPMPPINVDELKRLEESLNDLHRRIGEREDALRNTEDVIKRLREEIVGLENARRELARAGEFYDLLVKIREKIYHRDGPVIKSIRTWVLANVSSRAASYLNLFDVRISDIRVEEDRRGISFECSYGGRKVDSKRLSGGEKVALALAIRLAISDVLGAKKFGFFILDEPTVHLDSENKKKLQEVFASLGRAVRQTIVITHDEEVFEDVDAMILKFDRGPTTNAPTEVRVYRPLT